MQENQEATTNAQKKILASEYDHDHGQGDDSHNGDAELVIGQM